MSEPTPLTRALDLICADPKQRAAYMVGATVNGEPIDDVNTAVGAYLLLAEVPANPPPAEPAREWTQPDVEALVRAATAHRAQVSHALEALTVAYAQTFRDLDATGKAAAQGRVNACADRLARLVGR